MNGIALEAPSLARPIAGVARATVQPTATVRAAAPAVLGLEGIHLSFGGVAALQGVDLALNAGEILAVIGPNGAGKSSLVNVISGLYRPDRGRIRIGVREFRRVPTARLARLGVARTFQNLALFKGLNVLDNVALGCSASQRASFVEKVLGTARARRERRDAHDRAEVMIGFLGLEGVRDRRVDALPYGLQKRVELARALVAEPALLLLDEPMAGMGPADKTEMVRLVRSARDRFGTAILLIEHDIGLVLGLSDRVAVLEHGRKIADGTPAEVSSNPAVIDAYLGVDHGEDDSSPAFRSNA